MAAEWRYQRSPQLSVSPIKYLSKSTVEFGGHVIIEANGRDARNQLRTLRRIFVFRVIEGEPSGIGRAIFRQPRQYLPMTSLRPRIGDAGRHADDADSHVFRKMALYNF